MKRSVFGILHDRGEAEAVVSRLKTAGFPSESVSMLCPVEASAPHGTQAPEGVATGGTAGFVLGGVFGWLAGIGSFALPGIGPFIAAGPILATLSGAAIGAALGGLIGALIGLGIPEAEARRYAAQVEEGEYLLAVHADDEKVLELAKTILVSANADDLAVSAELTLPKESPVSSPVIAPEPERPEPDSSKG